ISPRSDLFNYAGLHRPVLLSLVPEVRVVDLTVVTSIATDKTPGVVQYEVKTSETTSVVNVELMDRSGKVVDRKKDAANGELHLTSAKLWWPFTMSGNEPAGYLYTLEVRVTVNNQLVDAVYQKVGIRSVSLQNNQLLVNGKPLDLRGFGKHEDQDVSANYLQG